MSDFLYNSCFIFSYNAVHTVSNMINKSFYIYKNVCNILYNIQITVVISW